MHLIKLSIALFLSSAFAVPFPSSSEPILVARDGTGSVTSTAGIAWYQANLTEGTSGRSDLTAYTCFSGPAANFPAISTWINFKSMWALQVKYALSLVDTTAEYTSIYNAILNISQVAKVDARVILATIMLESTGNVSVPCTVSYAGIPNCGIMQSYNPTDKTYNASNMQASITQMVQDGTQGTSAGPGLVQYFNDASDTPQETHGNVYAVFRSYNSGNVNASDLSDGEGANPAYVSDMANYLQGWNGYGAGPAPCAFMSPSPSPKSTSTRTATGTICASSAYIPAPTQTVSGTTSHCCKWVTVAAGDDCDTIDAATGISLAQLRAWNTYVDAACDNLWAGYAYCVGSSDPVGGSSSSSKSVTSKSTTTVTSGKTSSSSSKASNTSSKASSASSKASNTTSKTSSTTSKVLSTTSKPTTSTVTTKTSSTTGRASTTSSKA